MKLMRHIKTISEETAGERRETSSTEREMDQRSKPQVSWVEEVMKGCPSKGEMPGGGAGPVR